MFCSYLKQNGETGYFNATQVVDLKQTLGTSGSSERTTLTMSNNMEHDVPKKQSTLVATLEVAAAATSLTVIT